MPAKKPKISPPRTLSPNQRCGCIAWALALTDMIEAMRAAGFTLEESSGGRRPIVVGREGAKDEKVDDGGETEG